MHAGGGLAVQLGAYRLCRAPILGFRRVRGVHIYIYIHKDLGIYIYIHTYIYIRI